MDVNAKFQLFASNLLVKGASRSLVVDTHRQNMQLIPNALGELIMRHEGRDSISELLVQYDAEDRETLLEYFEFLLEKEIIFLTDTPEQFPKLDLSWDTPSHISNAIIEFNPSLSKYYEDLVSELNNLLCNHIEVRLFSEYAPQELDDFLMLFDHSIVLTIQLIVNYKSTLTEESYVDLLKRYPRISRISVYNADKAFKDTDSQESTKDARIVFHAGAIGNHSCGAISNAFFVPNLKGFTESLKYNSCLNRKVSVDGSGNIKNCPSLVKNFGNIKKKQLSEVIRLPEFQELWSINKDKIHVCKDCEFRFVCTDCRAFVDDPEDIFSKPLKCGYNPYTGQWSEWSENPLKQKAIETYGLQKKALTNSST